MRDLISLGSAAIVETASSACRVQAKAVFAREGLNANPVGMETDGTALVPKQKAEPAIMDQTLMAVAVCQ